MASSPTTYHFGISPVNGVFLAWSLKVAEEEGAQLPEGQLVVLVDGADVHRFVVRNLLVTLAVFGLLQVEGVDDPVSSFLMASCILSFSSSLMIPSLAISAIS